MRRDQDRAALREQKARIVEYLRANGLTHDPRFMVSQSSVSTRGRRRASRWSCSTTTAASCASTVGSA
jgi:hypothetical protein